MTTKIEVKTRYAGATYHARENRAGGARCSCTSGEDEAVSTLAAKIGHPNAIIVRVNPPSSWAARYFNGETLPSDTPDEKARVAEYDERGITHLIQIP